MCVCGGGGWQITPTFYFLPLITPAESGLFLPERNVRSLLLHFGGSSSVSQGWSSLLAPSMRVKTRSLAGRLRLHKQGGSWLGSAAVHKHARPESTRLLQAGATASTCLHLPPALRSRCSWSPGRLLQEPSVGKPSSAPSHVCVWPASSSSRRREACRW